MAYSSFYLPNADTYEPSTEFLNVAAQDDAPTWVLKSYYWGTLLFGCVNIVTAAGQIYTKMTCSHFDGSAETTTTVFEVFAWITGIMSVFIIAMSIYALIAKVGFAGQIKMIARSIAKGSKSSDNEFRLNELRTKMREQEETLVASAGRSNLQNQMETENFPYANIQTM